MIFFFMKKWLGFSFFPQNIDCGYTLEIEAVIARTFNLCFKAKIRKLCIPM